MRGERNSDDRWPLTASAIISAAAESPRELQHHRNSAPGGEGLKSRRTQNNESTAPAGVRGATRLLKIVYFDEDSASDFLDIAVGGRATSSSEKVRTRSTELRASVVAKLRAGFKFLPGLLGAAGSVQGSIDASSAGQSVIRKTISNTILTDYLAHVVDDKRVAVLKSMTVTAAPNSMAYMKMYTPLTTVINSAETGLDIAKLDDAFLAAKGYYELVASINDADECILRFNITSFRNNYRLTDLPQMRLSYHAVRVGDARVDQLGFGGAIDDEPNLLPSADQLLAGTAVEQPKLLPLYDVIMAGVEHDE